jgi:hypothetical protein
MASHHEEGSDMRVEEKPDEEGTAKGRPSGGGLSGVTQAFIQKFVGVIS